MQAGVGQIGVGMFGGRIRGATLLFICGFALAVVAIVLIMWWATHGTNIGTA